MRDGTYMLIGRLSSAILSVVLMASSLLKAVNVHSFATEVLLFSEAYVSSSLAPFSIEIACSVCAMELLLSMLLMRGRCKIAASALSFVLLSFFVALTGMNLLMPSSIGSIESCGCFGELVHFSPLGAFVKSVALWCVSILCLAALCKGTRFCRRTEKEEKGMPVYTLVFLLMSVEPPMLSLLCMERMSTDAYMSVYVVVCAAIVSFAISGVMAHMRKWIKIGDVLFDHVMKGSENTMKFK